jgi:hypothetical protein
VAEDVREVALDRLGADPEAQRDLLVRDARGHELEDLALAFGELLGRRRAAALAHEPPRDARGERRVAAGRGPDARGELVRLGVLQQVADRARVERRGDAHVVRERGEHEHRRTHAQAGDPARRLDAVDARHLEVHEHDVRLAVEGQVDRLLAVGGHADHLDVGHAGEQAVQARAYEVVVVDDEDPDRPALCGSEHPWCRALAAPDVTACQRRSAKLGASTAHRIDSCAEPTCPRGPAPACRAAALI